MKVDVYNGSVKSKTMDLSEVWKDVSGGVLHQVFVARMNNDRAGTASTKTKSEVAGGGRKPWKQKGLGRARAGSIRSPLWRGGGVTFGPKPKDYYTPVNKKQKTKAYLYVLSKMNELGRLKIVSDFTVDSFKTKTFLKALAGVVEKTDEKIVIVTETYDKNMVIGARNLSNISVFGVEYIDLLPMVYAAKIVITEKAMKVLDERFSKLLKGE